MLMEHKSPVEYIDETVEPMPWIGLYAAGASLICTLAMAADTFLGIRSKKLWFPCKFFSLNATTLTLLAVAMKLSVDLNTEMTGRVDQLSKLSGTILLSTAMGNCLISLGSMDNRSILMNVTALVILVITVIINVCIQIRANAADYSLWTEFSLTTVLMLVLVLIFVSSALTVPTTKKHIEAKYQEIHRKASNVEQDESGKFSTENLKSVIRKYWVMAATGNPQFVMARSATSTSCGAISLLISFTLLEAAIRMQRLYWDYSTLSDYQWSTMCILVVQSVGIAVGTIAPILRWFTAVTFMCLDEGRERLKNEFKTETYWIQRLEDWKESSLSLPIRSIKCRRLVHKTKYWFLSLCIKVQIVIVLTSKITRLFYAFLLSLFQLCLSHFEIFKVEPEFKSFASTDQRAQESEPGYQELNSYVLLLEGEVGLPRRILKKIFYEVDQLILTGKKQQPKFLIDLLGRSTSFNGLAYFDSHQVPSLHSQEPPNCWTLPVVTLTSIAIALPNIENDKAARLLRSVSQGLRYATLREKCQNTRRGFVNISKAADVVWVGVELCKKWLDEDLNNLKGKTSKEILEGLAKTAERSLMEFKTSINEKIMENPIHWPVKTVAANSMYRISRTLLLAYEGGNDLRDEELFEKLSATIADIFSACLMSLAHLIIMKCHCDAIEMREQCVQEAAILLGESEKILEILQQRHVTGTIPYESADLDEWRVLIKQRSPVTSICTSTNEATHRPSSDSDEIIGSVVASQE